MIILFLILGAIGLTAAVLIAVSLLREEGIEIWQPDCPCGYIKSEKHPFDINHPNWDPHLPGGAGHEAEEWKTGGW